MGAKNKIGISEIISTQNVRNKLVMFLIFHTIGLLCSSKFSCLYETEAIQTCGKGQKSRMMKKLYKSQLHTITKFWV